MTTARRLTLLVLLAIGFTAAAFVPPVPISLPGMGWITGVPVGPKRILLAYESSNSDIKGLLGSLRQEPFIAANGHTLDILDLDAVDKDGKPAPAVVQFKADYPAVAPPALLIAVPGGRVVYCDSLPANATAAGILATIKANGGGE